MTGSARANRGVPEPEAGRETQTNSAQLEQEVVHLGKWKQIRQEKEVGQRVGYLDCPVKGLGGDEGTLKKGYQHGQTWGGREADKVEGDSPEQEPSQVREEET